MKTNRKRKEKLHRKSDSVYNKAERRGLVQVNISCPNVKKIQEIYTAADFDDDYYHDDFDYDDVGIPCGFFLE